MPSEFSLLIDVLGELSPTNAAAREALRRLMPTPPGCGLDCVTVLRVLGPGRRSWDQIQLALGIDPIIPSSEWAALHRTFRNRVTEYGISYVTHTGLLVVADAMDVGIRAKPRSFPRIWELMGYLLPPKAHDRLWIPAIEDQKRKYYEARHRYRTRAARVWLTIAFTIRTLLMVPDCYRVMGISKLRLLVEALIPEPVKRWWLGL